MTATLKIHSKQLNSIVLLKLLSGTEQLELVECLIDYVDDLKDHSGFLNYYKLLVSKVITNKESIIKEWKANKDLLDEAEEKDIIELLYKCVTKAYPHFALEIVCDRVNSDTYVSEFKDDIVIVEGLGAVLKSAHPELAAAVDKQAKAKKQTEAKKKKAQQKLDPLTLDEINLLENALNNSVIGQKEAITKIVNLIKVKEAKFTATFSALLIGRTGQGKTLLARALAKYYTHNRLIFIDGSTYTDGHEKTTLLGAPPGYVGHSGTSFLGEKAKESNKWVFLIDESEKADQKTLDNLMNLIENGKIIDSMGKELDFSNSVFILTSNEGIDYSTKQRKVGFNELVTSQTNSEIITNLEKKFRKEFLNRLDEIIVVNSLSKDDVRKITALELAHYPIEINEELIDYIVTNSYSEEYGARNIKRFIKANIGVKLADNVLSSKNKNGTYFFREGQIFCTQGQASKADV